MREMVAKWLRSLRWRYIDIPALRPGTVGAYTLAFVAVGVATALRIVLDPYLEGAQFITFYPAIVATTLVSGFGAGVLCAVLSATAAWSFFLHGPAEDVVDLLLFVVTGLFIVILASRTRVAIEFEQAAQAQRASKDRLHLALNAAQLGWWQNDPLSDVILVDARMKEIFDFTADETSIEEFVRRVHPDDMAKLWADRDAALDPADPKPFAHEYRILRRDGEVRWVEAHGLAYFEGSRGERRPVSFFGTVQDITERKNHEEERKRREEHEHLLMREVNHRAKNMLSVVDAIAHQIATKNPEDFVERFSERIQALSANQDILVRHQWKGVEVEELVRTQLAHFAGLIGSRILVHGPELRFEAASAQTIGLALHELATNAGKYGALSTDTGRVDVGWRTEGATFTMTWTERGGPPVSPPQRLGFGTVVMQKMTERSVDGRVELDYAPSGVTWRLTCPAVNALESPEARGEETTREQPTPENANHGNISYDVRLHE